MKLLPLALLVALASPAAALAAPGPSNPYAGTPEGKLALARVDAAHHAYDAVRARWKSGQARLDDVYAWSVRWLDASLDQTAWQDTNQALKDHLARMRELETAVDAQYRHGIATSADVAFVTYYRTDAELRAAYGITP